MEILDVEREQLAPEVQVVELMELQSVLLHLMHQIILVEVVGLGLYARLVELAVQV